MAASACGLLPSANAPSARAEDRLVDRTAAEVGDGEQVQADLRDLGLHVGEGGGEPDDGAEVAGQHRRVAQRSLTTHRDAGDRVPAATATDRVATVDLLPQDLEVVGGPGGSATDAVVPPVHVHAELSAVRHDHDPREAGGQRGDARNPGVRAAVGAMEEPENGIAALRVGAVAVRQQDMDLRDRAAMFERAAGRRGVDQLARELEGLQLGARRRSGSQCQQAQRRNDEEPASATVESPHAASELRESHHQITCRRQESPLRHGCDIGLSTTRRSSTHGAAWVLSRLHAHGTYVGSVVPGKASVLATQDRRGQTRHRARRFRRPCPLLRRRAERSVASHPAMIRLVLPLSRCTRIE